MLSEKLRKKGIKLNRGVKRMYNDLRLHDLTVSLNP